jgi:2-phosphosulfolactate phosphatase
MRIIFFPTLELADREAFPGRTVVVIDVLRFTSAVIAALEAGATKIIPVEDIETATQLADSGRRRVKLLAGERKGLPVEGFDLFNSPAEFTRNRVEGKTIIMTTSNGSRAVVAAAKASRLLICAINNVGAVARSVENEDEIVLLCSGSEGWPAMEDIYCAGLLMLEFGKPFNEDSVNDAGKMALLLARAAGSGSEELLARTDRGRELIANGHGKDILRCAEMNRSVIVPELRQGALKAM